MRSEEFRRGWRPSSGPYRPPTALTVRARDAVSSSGRRAHPVEQRIAAPEAGIRSSNRLWREARWARARNSPSPRRRPAAPLDRLADTPDGFAINLALTRSNPMDRKLMHKMAELSLCGISTGAASPVRRCSPENRTLPVRLPEWSIAGRVQRRDLSDRRAWRCDGPALQFSWDPYGGSSAISRPIASCRIDSRAASRPPAGATVGRAPERTTASAPRARPQSGGCR